MTRRVCPIGSTQLEDLLPALASLLADTVNGGESLGFLPPVSIVECRNYWLSLRGELRAGSRLLFGMWVGDRLAGSGQLALPRWPNARHRAEVNKLLVATALRGQGLGRYLLGAMHDAAQQRGRTLLMLNTRRGGRAEQFYRGLGYREAGMIPGYAVGPGGEAVDSLLMYRSLCAEDPKSF
jgi:ribosomal protein S18 acetylase RimI-like enzyme